MHYADGNVSPHKPGELGKLSPLVAMDLSRGDFHAMDRLLRCDIPAGLYGIKTKPSVGP